MNKEELKQKLESKKFNDTTIEFLTNAINDVEELYGEYISEETIFDFGGHDYDTYVNAVSAAEEISISGLHFIICTLLDRYGRKYEEISLDGFSCATSKIHFAIKDLSNGEVLFYKDPEESPFWKARGKEPLEVTNFLNQYAASGCKYIYLMV